MTGQMPRTLSLRASGVQSKVRVRVWLREIRTVNKGTTC